MAEEDKKTTQLDLKTSNLVKASELRFRWDHNRLTDALLVQLGMLVVEYSINFNPLAGSDKGPAYIGWICFYETDNNTVRRVLANGSRVIIDLYMLDKTPQHLASIHSIKPVLGIVHGRINGRMPLKIYTELYRH